MSLIGGAKGRDQLSKIANKTTANFNSKNLLDLGSKSRSLLAASPIPEEGR